jgi:hypothetical protein
MADTGYWMENSAVCLIKHQESSIEYRIYFVPSTLEGALVSN